MTREGPGGLKFTGTVGGRRGYMLPSFLTDIVGSDTPVELAGMQLLDPYQPDTVWDATFRVERGFDAGPMEIRLVGEALVSFGRTPDLTSGNSSGSQLQWREDPQRLTGGAARLGLVLGF